MSICINNDLIWVSTPRCASHSIEYALMNNPNLNCNHFIREYNNVNFFNETFKKNDNKVKHFHFDLDLLYNNFGYKETICITRDWFELWLSSLEVIYKFISKLKLFVNWEDVDNMFIYKTFDSNFVNDLHNKNSIKCLSRLVDEDESTISNFNLLTSILILSSRSAQLLGGRCTYEFDINEIDEFKKFIQNRYNVQFELPFLNKRDKIKNNIIVDDELRNWVWDKFEKPFIKSNKLI